MIINSEIKALVKDIEGSGLSVPDASVRRLVRLLADSCARPENRRRYADDPARAHGAPMPYPLDEGGYAAAFDPLEDEAGFVNAWRCYGIVVGKAVLPPAECRKAVNGIKARFNAVSNGTCDMDRRDTWHNMPTDENGTPLLSRGFLEIYHDDILAEIRQNVRAYIHHVLIWGRADLWTSFDRVGVKLPGHEESRALPLHVDQNPNVHPGFKTVQGVLALTDCPAERGTFLGVPGSRRLFAAYAGMAKNSGEYVELDPAAPIARALQAGAQPFPLRAGDFVSWDSRTTHANTENLSEDTRMVLYMAAGPAREDSPAALAARRAALESGVGSNVREALMHASKKPRYTSPETLGRLRQSEHLTLLGKLLYGTVSYKKIAAAPAP